MLQLPWVVSILLKLPHKASIYPPTLEHIRSSVRRYLSSIIVLSVFSIGQFKDTIIRTRHDEKRARSKCIA